MRVYECVMTVTCGFSIAADNGEEVQEWLQTHDIKDVQLRTDMYQMDYDESIEFVSCERDWVERGVIDIRGDEE